MGTKSPLQITEAAVVAHLQAQTELTGLSIVPGIETTVQDLPIIIVSCDNCTTIPDLPEGLGNYAVSINIAIYTSADEATALNVHRARSAAVLGAMQSLSALKAVFTSQADATLYDIIDGQVEESTGDRTFGMTCSFTAYIVLPA
jgi:hypothetical protein